MLKYYLKIYTLGIILFSLNLFSIDAQVSVIDTSMTSHEGKGKVVDEFGQPLVGVTIITNEGKFVGISNENGLFDLSAVTTGKKIILDYKGYNSKTVFVKDTSSLTVRLKEHYLKSPDKIVGFYDEKDRKQELGSVSSVHTPELTTTPSPLYLNALEGRLPGLYIQEVNGFRVAGLEGISSANTVANYSAPNEATRYKSVNTDNSELGFNLRGQTPVTIIDGVQRDIYAIDPECIESVSVLKDAVSSLLLGLKSSKGVLLVTTKRGIIGAPRVSFTAETGWQNRLQTPKPLSAYQYAYLYNEALENDGKAPVYSADKIDAFHKGNSPYAYPDVDWYKTITRNNTPISKYSLNINGGLKNARYSVSVGYLNQKGMFKTSDAVNYNTNLQLQRYLINSSIDVNITKDLTVGLQLLGRIQDGCQPGAGTSSILNDLYKTPNSEYPIFNPDHSYGGSSAHTRNLYQLTANSGYILDNARDLIVNFDLKYKFDNILPGLYFKLKANESTNTSAIIRRSSLQPVYDFTISDAGDTTYTRYGTISDQTNSFSITSVLRTLYSQATVGYDAKIGNHQFSGMIFADEQQATYQFDLPEMYYNMAASVKYNYKQKYFAEGVVNYAGFDRYQPGHQFGLFYAGGVGWNIAEEAFVKDNLKWVNLFKLRGTYGLTGNTNEGGLGYYSWRSAFGQDGVNNYPSGSSYAAIFTTVELSLPNAKQTWEKAHKLNVGSDMTFFKSHLTIAFDYYYDIYFDLLQQRGTNTQLMGLAYSNENIGKNLYTGQELQVTYQNHLGNFNYFISANASRMKTEVLAMDELSKKYDWNKRTHRAIGQLFGYVADGLIQSQEEASKAPMVNKTAVHPGDIKLVDLNNDGVIDQFDETAIGNTKPIIYYGTTLGFSFVGFDVSVLLQGVKNRSYIQIDQSFGSGTEQGYDFLIGRWTPETAKTATYPRLTAGTNATNNAVSSYWVHSGAYFRIKNIDIGYNLPYNICNRLKVSGIKIFANGQNLFTETSYNRLDPEINSATAYPIQRTFNAGINIKL